MVARKHLIDTIADLTSATANPKANLKDGQQITVAGYYAAGDKEAATYVWNAASTATANGGTVLAHDDGGTGRFLLEKDVVSVLDFGAVGDARSGTSSGDKTAESTVFVSGALSATQADVGKVFRLEGAGTAGAALITTVSIVTNGSNITLADAIVTTVSAPNWTMGTDDTAAIQAAVNASSHVFLPDSSFLITDRLQLSGSNKRIYGASQTAKILQAGENVPIFNFIGTNMGKWLLSDLTLAFAGERTSAQPLAVGILLGWTGATGSTINLSASTIENIHVLNHYKGISTHTATAAQHLWGSYLNRLSFSNGYGAAIDNRSTTGSPALNIDNIYVRAERQAQTIFILGSSASRIGLIEVNLNTNGVGIVEFPTGAEFVVDCLKDELGVYETKSSWLFYYVNARISIRLVRLVSTTINPINGAGAANIYMFRLGASGASALNVANIEMTSTTVTTGSMSVFLGNYSVNDLVDFGRTKLDTGVNIYDAGLAGIGAAAFSRSGLSLARKYRKLSAAPTALKEGDVAYADGTTWNPGAGSGLYLYDGAAWRFLGGAGTV